MTQRLVSNRVAGAVYQITREDYDDGFVYHAWRDVRGLVAELGAGFGTSEECDRETALKRAKDVCTADAARRIGRE